MILFMPPLVHARQRESSARSGAGEIREVMHKCLDFRRLLFALEIGFGALVLPERVQLGNEEPSFAAEDAIRFGKDERKIAYMFEHQVASY